MNILGVNGNPVVVGGKVILPPSSADVRIDQVEPYRYNHENFTLDLQGLVTGKYFICVIFGIVYELNQCVLTLTYVGEDSGNVCSLLGFAEDGTISASSIASLIQDNITNNVVDISEVCPVEGSFSEINYSCIVSWN